MGLSTETVDEMRLAVLIGGGGEGRREHGSTGSITSIGEQLRRSVIIRAASLRYVLFGRRQSQQ